MTGPVSPVKLGATTAPADAAASVRTPGCARTTRSTPYIATSFRLSIINWLNIAFMYVPYALGAASLAAAAALVPRPLLSDPHALAAAVASLASYTWSNALPCAVLLAAVVVACSLKAPVYLVDFAVYQPPADWRVSKEDLLQCLRAHKDASTGECVYTPDSIDFMARLLERSGTGEATHWPGSTVKLIRPSLASTTAGGGGAESEAAPAAGEGVTGCMPVMPDRSIATARANAERVMFACVQTLIDDARLVPRELDFVIVNCSLFCPTPSLASSICRKFGLRPDVRSYNLGGMGCSAGVISIDLAKQLLQNKPGSQALVVSLEDITQQLYLGNDRAMLVQNTLFRVGGAAILLSNKPMDAFRAKYKLMHTVRVQDTSDTAHSAVYQCEDTAGSRGVALSKDITTVAAKTLRDNLTLMGPFVLPLREQARVLLSIAARRVVDVANAAAARMGMKARLQRGGVYVPDFKTGVHHFCIHAGGRAVIDGIEANLKLLPHHTAPSRATLHNYGNTSSSSIWYELKYVEAETEAWRAGDEHGGSVPIQRGERVLQIAFGSGFKCNSAVWLRLR